MSDINDRLIPEDDDEIARVPLEILPEGGLGTRFAASMRSFNGDAPRDTLLDSIEGGGLTTSFRDLNDTAVNQLNLNFSAEYERPDRKIAQQFRAYHHPARLDGSPLPYSLNTGQYGTCCSKRVTHLRPFGSGISNYFKWLKYLGLMFLILSGINLPALCINLVSGAYFTSGDYQFPSTLAGTTLGNLDYKNDSLILEVLNLDLNTNQSLVDLISNATNLQSTLRMPWLCGEDNPEDCLVSRGEVLVWYSVADAFGMLLFWISILIVERFIIKEERDFRKKVLKVEDFSIEVRNLPPKITAKELEEHFGINFGAIYDVQIVEATGSAIEMCVIRGRMMKRLARQDALVRRLILKSNVIREKGAKAYEDLMNSPIEDGGEEGIKRQSSNSSGADQKPTTTKARENNAKAEDKMTEKIEKAKQKFDKIYKKIEELDQKAANRRRNGMPLLAFITFEQVSARDTCVDLFKKWYWWTPDPKTLYNEKRLQVNKAPPPSTLLWENTDYTNSERRVRWCIAVAVLLLVLCATASLTYVADGLQTSFADLARTGTELINEIDVCDNKYNGLSVSEAIDLALENKDEDWGINCLCQNEVIFQKALYPGNFTTFYDPDDGVCTDFVLDRGVVIGTSIGISAGVLVMNTAINVILLTSASFMKFPSIVQRESTLFKLVFLLTFVNTALIVLAVNTDIEALLDVELPFEELLNIGTFTDFSSGWYEKVGLEILFVLSLNIFAPHVFPTLKAFQALVKRRYMKHLSQAEMNDAFLGPEFVLSFRYAQILLLVFFVLLYAAGMPIVYFFATASILVTYFVDKFFFLRVCRTPPRYTVDLGKWANSMMEWAILFHLGFAIWMYSSPKLFPISEDDNRHSILSFVSEESGLPVTDILTSKTANLTDSSVLEFASPYLDALNKRLVRDQSIPLFLLWLVIVIVKVLRLFDFVGIYSAKAVQKLASCFQRCFGSDPLNQFDHMLGFDEEEHAPRYQQAVKRNKVVGIKNYNILANPVYSHAFQLAAQDDGGKVYQSLEQSLRLQVKKKSDDTDDGQEDESEGDSHATWFKRIKKMKKRIGTDKESDSGATVPSAAIPASSEPDSEDATTTVSTQSKKQGRFGKLFKRRNNKDPKATAFATAADLAGEEEANDDDAPINDDEDETTSKNDTENADENSQ